MTRRPMFSEVADGQTAAIDAPSSLTILHSLDAPLTKRIYLDRNREVQRKGYGNAKTFRVETAPISNLRDLAAVLDRLEGNSRACVIRGALLPGADASCTRRLLHAAADGTPAAFEAAARPWLMIDADGIEAPASVDPTDNPEGAIEYLIGQLPPEFWDASCWWQWSSSQGFKGDKLSAHLWYWIDRSVTDAELRRWAESLNRTLGRRLIDPALFSPVQVHYTAAPSIGEDVRDPLPKRSGFREGLEEAVSLDLSPAEVADLDAGDENGLRAAVGVEGYLAQIGSEAGFRQPILSAVASYVGRHGVAGTDIGALKEVIRAAVLVADPGPRPAGEITRYASDHYLDDVIRWVSQQDLASSTSPVALEAADVPDALARYEYPAALGQVKLLQAMTDWFVRSLDYLRARDEAAKAAETARADVIASAGCVVSLDEIEDISERARWESILGRHVMDAWEAVRIKRGVVSWDRPPWLVIRGAAGLGKTALWAQLLAIMRDGWDRHIDVYTMRTDLIQAFTELSKTAIEDARLGRVALTAAAMLGRGQSDPRTGKPLCRRAKDVEIVGRSGAPVQSTMCLEPVPDGEPLKCLHYDWCRKDGYQSQFRFREPMVRIWSHQHLALHRLKGFPFGEIGIVDESFTAALTETKHVKVMRLLEPRRCSDHPDHAMFIAFCGAIVEAMSQCEGGRGLLAELRRLGVTVDQLTWAADAEIRLSTGDDASIHPNLPDDVIAKRLEANPGGGARKRALLFTLLAAEMSQPRDDAYTVEPRLAKKGKVFLHIKKRLQLRPYAPMLFLDASADLEILRGFFGDHLEMIEIPVERRAHIIQVSSAPFSDLTLLGDYKGANEERRARADRYIEKFTEFVRWQVRRRGIGLIVCNLKVRRRLTGESAIGRPKTSTFWEGAFITHFSALRGSDKFKHFDWAIFLGRQQPGPREIERYARAIWGDSPEPIEFVDNYVKERRYLTRRDGARVAVDVRVHPDRRAQRVLEQVREGETSQGLDRLRLVHRKRTAEIFIISNVPVPGIQPDELVSWDDLIRRTKGCRRALDDHGFLPLSPADAAVCFPSLFANERAARYAIDLDIGTQRHIDNRDDQKSYMALRRNIQTATYRRHGARGRPSRVLYEPHRFPTPEALAKALSGRLGHEIVDVTLTDEPLAASKARAAATDQQPSAPAHPVTTGDQWLPLAQRLGGDAPIIVPKKMAPQTWYRLGRMRPGNYIAPDGSLKRVGLTLLEFGGGRA